MNNFSKLFLTTLTGFSLLSVPNALAQPRENIALGKAVTFNSAPNYEFSTDSEDITQLTDGRYSGNSQAVQGTRALWVQKETVGWQNIKPVIITIDLGKIQTISGASFNTAGGGAGVTWPTAIYMAVSDDGEIWHDAGDLVVLSRENGTPLSEAHSTFRYVTHKLKTKGRYIAFATVSVPFVFTDEIEVYKGDEAWINYPNLGRQIVDLKIHANQSLITSAVQRRLYDDIATVRKNISTTQINPQQKTALLARLERYARETANLPQLPSNFPTQLPLNDTHRGILSVHGEVLAAQKFKVLTVWRQGHRYDWLPFLAKPLVQVPTQLKISMLSRQFRSDAFLITNASGQSKKLTLQIDNVPRDAQKGWLQVSSIAWWDTSQGIPAAEPLIPLEPQSGLYTLVIPAGMTSKIWLTVDSSKVPAGTTTSSVKVVSGTQKVTVPLQLNISKTAMNSPRLSQGMWDYTNSTGLYGVTPDNRDSAIALMRSHFVDSPWSNRASLLPPHASAFDAQGNLLKNKLDFSEFDQWIARWPGAKRYYVYLGLPNQIAGFKTGTPEFAIRAGNWAKALSAHMKELDLQPQQLGLLLVDEPYEPEMYETTAAWAKAFKSAAPELTLFCDPRFGKTEESKILEVLELMDVICPALSSYETGSQALQKHFDNLHKQGKELWFYQTSGPSWQLDPQNYYRHQAWYVFSANGKGQGFWSFGDTGGAPISWYGYSGRSTYYALGFFDTNRVHSTVHWEAVREGVEDFEELSMLQDAIISSRNPAWKARAEQVLEDATHAITGNWNAIDGVQNKKPSALADQQLEKVRELLNTKS